MKELISLEKILLKNGDDKGREKKEKKVAQFRGTFQYHVTCVTPGVFKAGYTKMKQFAT